MRSLKDDAHAMVDIGLVITIGVVFAGLMVLAYIVWTLIDSLQPEGAHQNNSYFRGLTETENASYNESWNSLANITSGFDSAVSLLLVANTISILAIAIMALLMLRGGQQ